MAHEIIMPKAGMAMETGTIVHWLKDIGDSVSVGEPLLEIETDKVTMEVEAEYSGTLLAKLRDDGDVVPVIETIGYIGEKGEKPPGGTSPVSGRKEDGASQVTPRKNGVPSGSSEPAASAGAQFGDRARATPAARRLARERRLDIADIPAGAKWNAVTAADVEAAAGGGRKLSPLAEKIASMKGIDTSGLSGSGPGGRIMKRDLRPPTQPVHRPMSSMRAVIARRMGESHRTVPSVTLNRTAEVTRLLEYREALNEGVRSKEDSEGVAKVSVTDMIVKAVALLLPGHPLIRTRIEGESLVEMPGSDIGLAVAVPGGLLVPVIRNVAGLSLTELAGRRRDLAVRARSGKLSPDELEGAVFSVSNLGMYGVTSFNPIINLPEAAILGVGAVEERLTMEEGLIQQKKLIHLSLTIDHRIIDGAEGALFLQDLARSMEAPYSL